MVQKDRDKVLVERIALLKSDFATLSSPDEYSVKGVTDMILDKDMEFTPHALGFALRTLKVPQSYFIASSDNHKQEILRHAVNVADPDFAYSVVRTDGKVLAVGHKSSKEVAEGFGELFDEFGGRIADVNGSLLAEGNVRAFLEFSEFISGTRYKVGLSLYLTPLFCRGFSIYPKVMEVRCTNGMMEQIEGMEAMRLPSGRESLLAIRDGRAAAMAILEERSSSYVEFFNVLGKRPVPTVASLMGGLSIRRLPKGYMDRVEPLLNATIGNVEGTEISPDLPDEVKSARDVLSVLTFAARDFSPATRNNLESTLMRYAWEWLKAA